MGARWRVLLTDRAWPDWSIESEILAAADAELVPAPNGDEATLIQLAADCDAIGTNWAQVTPAVIQACTRCRIVSRFGIGLDNIAVDVATSRKIPVTNVPDYCVEEVADHALALLLAAARNVAFFHLRTKRGEYKLNAGPPMKRLAGKTLGLIGCGRIGSLLAVRAAALGLKILVYTRSGTTPLPPGCERSGLNELLVTSDFVSLHAPLTNETRGLIGLEQFRLMQRSAWLINTSRGGLIDVPALTIALQENLIAGAALDVFNPEPPDLNLPVYQDERVILTPHAAFVSQESLAELRTRAAHQIAASLRGEHPENVVNPQVYE